MRFNEREFRDAMGQFCTGVVVVTGFHARKPVGFSAQSFVSLSLQPPLVAISPARTSSTWPLLRAAGRFGINILGADQQALCAGFARSGVEKFEQVRWSGTPEAGPPRLDGIIGFVDCTLEAEHEAGDHTLVIGRVQALRVCAQQRSPLLFFRGRYGAFEPLPPR